jgi:hypothetical protein
MKQTPPMFDDSTPELIHVTISEDDGAKLCILNTKTHEVYHPLPGRESIGTLDEIMSRDKFIKATFHGNAGQYLSPGNRVKLVGRDTTFEVKPHPPTLNDNEQLILLAVPGWPKYPLIFNEQENTLSLATDRTEFQYTLEKLKSSGIHEDYWTLIKEGEVFCAGNGTYQFIQRDLLLQQADTPSNLRDLINLSRQTHQRFPSDTEANQMNTIFKKQRRVDNWRAQSSTKATEVPNLFLIKDFEQLESFLTTLKENKEAYIGQRFQIIMCEPGHYCPVDIYIDEQQNIKSFTLEGYLEDGEDLMKDTQKLIGIIEEFTQDNPGKGPHHFVSTTNMQFAENVCKSFAMNHASTLSKLNTTELYETLKSVSEKNDKQPVYLTVNYQAAQTYLQKGTQSFSVDQADLFSSVETLKLDYDQEQGKFYIPGIPDPLDIKTNDGRSVTTVAELKELRIVTQSVTASVLPNLYDYQGDLSAGEAKVLAKILTPMQSASRFATLPPIIQEQLVGKNQEKLSDYMDSHSEKKDAKNVHKAIENKANKHALYAEQMLTNMTEDQYNALLFMSGPDIIAYPKLLAAMNDPSCYEDMRSNLKALSGTIKKIGIENPTNLDKSSEGSEYLTLCEAVSDVIYVKNHLEQLKKEENKSDIEAEIESLDTIINKFLENPGSSLVAAAAPDATAAVAPDATAAVAPDATAADAAATAAGATSAAKTAATAATATRARPRRTLSLPGKAAEPPETPTRRASSAGAGR